MGQPWVGGGRVARTESERGRKEGVDDGERERKRRRLTDLRVAVLVYITCTQLALSAILQDMPAASQPDGRGCRVGC